jgi:formyltetrahydrofolate-dependent phosphoribosylglycinamide formyltransferase
VSGGYAAPGRFQAVPVRLVVLASGSGSTLQAVLDAVADGHIPAVIAAAGTDRPGCAAMSRATAAGLPTFACAVADYPSRAQWDDALFSAIDALQADLVVLAGFMRVIAAATVTRFPMVNTHPSLLPAFPGAHAIRDALRHGVKVSGVTVHRVDAGLDSGPILAQQAVPVFPDDTEDTLRERIQQAEKPLFIDTIRQLCISIEESHA